MNALEIFFGWLIKGEAQVSIFDGIMLCFELVTIIFIIGTIWTIKDKIKEYRQDKNK